MSVELRDARDGPIDQREADRRIESFAEVCGPFGTIGAVLLFDDGRLRVGAIHAR